MKKLNLLSLLIVLGTGSIYFVSYREGISRNVDPVKETNVDTTTMRFTNFLPIAPFGIQKDQQLQQHDTSLVDSRVSESPALIVP